MSPKFSLGVALGFAATVIFKNKPHRKALQAAHALEPDLQIRLAAVEAQLEQTDQLILRQAKWVAARAFRPPQAGSIAALSQRRAENQRRIESLRQAIDSFAADSRCAIAASRETVEAWLKELPARLAASADETTFEEPPPLQLPAPPPTEA